MSNRLSGSTSAYLASAAHQPVAWYPWGEAAFAAALEGDKPILLDVGAAWCHWCHVMDGESYEDPALAELLNRHFICIKVDRDERPDVDARYQRAVQLVTGQGGWPLTAFLTPEGEVFYGGTYFPPDGRQGRPGFRSVLERVSELYRGERGKIAPGVAEIREHLAQSLLEAREGQIDPRLPEIGAERMARLFDFRYGGFGQAPKFPHPAAVLFLLERWSETGDEWLREMVEKTLDGMAKGGLHDQIGGGFHRYAVDERWIVPHFEKLLCDNAELLKLYAHAHAALGTPLYRDVAEGIVDWTLEVLCEKERGGFYASQDADVGLHDDGDYFTWTEAEAEAALSPEEWKAAQRYWHIYADGEMQHDPRRNVLFVAREPPAIALELERPEEEVRALIRSSGAKLREARRARPAPAVDRSLYTNWNAMMAEAFLLAGEVLGRRECSDLALRTLERLWSEGYVPGSGTRHRLREGALGEGAGDGEGDEPGTGAQSGDEAALLDDQVQAASAVIAAYEQTGTALWLERAQDLTALVEARFGDSAAGGYFDTAGSDGAGFLAQRAKPIQDAPTPSANAVAALNLLRLHAILKDDRYREKAERLLRAFAGAAAELGLYGATWLRAVGWLLRGGRPRLTPRPAASPGA